MKPGPANAKKIFVNSIRVDAAPKTAVDWLVDISIDQGWYSSRDGALEAAEKWEKRFLDLLR